MSLVSKKWVQAKRLRAEQIGGKRCEICGTTEGQIVGHHLSTYWDRDEGYIELYENIVQLINK